ncbi:MAG: maleylacetoacetate isomerase [Rhodospirillaceae bacterium]|jgi:maleylpyruvate isomerase|nr:maleylacetoacetate isomerase [Rhodospirillaceae bacterium]MBT4589648.1 maleylacetoacetate isomerase [Rhodospirillaceae bacterium]MBT4941114.1 maleylacetoacetate isomerase [Rhodospirillaceae bacterium]MBT5940730.1 maleylacetoacetate isomerase [Rhodospirillaceae bacterium]MBT7267045.1 maleylacetoacetate isomerase [Rhodospirillaceae bacterium]
MKLYDYFRSSAAYRARIALNLKELDYEHISVHLTKEGGEQFKSDYTELNPQNLVPTLIDGKAKITQSMAIMEYLEEVYPEPSFLPGDAVDRAQIRALANIVACDIHPLNNLRIRLYLVDEMDVSVENREVWMGHWVRKGFEAYEKLYAQGPTGKFSHGDQPSMADICLIPQMANARRPDHNIDVADFPTLLKIEEACQALPAFEKALPANQPDAE